MYVYKQSLALNNPQWLICHKTKPNHYLVDQFTCRWSLRVQGAPRCVEQFISWNLSSDWSAEYRDKYGIGTFLPSDQGSLLYRFADSRTIRYILTKIFLWMMRTQKLFKIFKNNICVCSLEDLIIFLIFKILFLFLLIYWIFCYKDLLKKSSRNY